jgi:hypothetical protein
MDAVVDSWTMPLLISKNMVLSQLLTMEAFMLDLEHANTMHQKQRERSSP